MTTLTCTVEDGRSVLTGPAGTLTYTPAGLGQSITRSSLSADGDRCRPARHHRGDPMTVPTYTLRCHSAGHATQLVPLLRRMGLIGAEADDATVAFPYGNPDPTSTLIEVTELARHLDLAGDVEASELLMQGVR